MAVALILLAAWPGPVAAQDVALDCDYFNWQEQAQAILDEDPDDPNGLDEFGDGVACPDLPSGLDEPDPFEATPSAGDSLRCVDFPFQELAQDELDADPRDPHGLDPSGDGTACRRLPLLAEYRNGNNQNAQVTDSSAPDPDREARRAARRAERAAEQPTTADGGSALRVDSVNQEDAGIGDGTISVYVEVTNVSGRLLDYAGIEVICRNNAGTVVAQGIANTLNFPADQSRVLTAVILEAQDCDAVEVQPDGLTDALN